MDVINHSGAGLSMTHPTNTNEILRFDIKYQGFSTFGVAEVRLRNGTIVRREIEDHGAAAAVLPYDPVRKIALLVEQFRPPVLHAGDAEPLLEAPAGLIDDETPDAAIRREALEEVGLVLTEIESVGTVFAMPGLSTEKISLFLARFSAAQKVAAGGGLESENEDIRVVEIGLDALARMARNAEIRDMKTLTLILTLQLRHPDLF